MSMKTWRARTRLLAESGTEVLSKKYRLHHRRSRFHRWSKECRTKDMQSKTIAEKVLCERELDLALLHEKGWVARNIPKGNTG